MRLTVRRKTWASKYVDVSVLKIAMPKLTSHLKSAKRVISPFSGPLCPLRSQGSKAFCSFIPVISSDWWLSRHGKAIRTPKKKKKRNEGKNLRGGTLENNYPYSGLLDCPGQSTWHWEPWRCTGVGMGKVFQSISQASPEGLGLFIKKTASRGL